MDMPLTASCTNKVIEGSDLTLTTCSCATAQTTCTGVFPLIVLPQERTPLALVNSVNQYSTKKGKLHVLRTSMIMFYQQMSLSCTSA